MHMRVGSRLSTGEKARVLLLCFGFCTQNCLDNFLRNNANPPKKPDFEAGSKRKTIFVAPDEIVISSRENHEGLG